MRSSAVAFFFCVRAPNVAPLTCARCAAGQRHFVCGCPRLGDRQCAACRTPCTTPDAGDPGGGVGRSRHGRRREIVHTHTHTFRAHHRCAPSPAPTRSHRPPPYTQTVVCTHSAPDLSSGGHSKHSDVFTVNTVTSVYLPDAVVGRAFRETDTGEVLLAGRAMLVAWKRASCRRSWRCGKMHLPEYTVHAAV